MLKNKDKYYFETACGEVLTEIRIEQGYKKQKQYSKHIEMEQTQYSRYENGKNITRDTLYQILEELSTSLEVYFMRVFEKIRKMKTDKKDNKKTINQNQTP